MRQHNFQRRKLDKSWHVFDHVIFELVPSHDLWGRYPKKEHTSCHRSRPWSLWQRPTRSRREWTWSGSAENRPPQNKLYLKREPRLKKQTKKHIRKTSMTARNCRENWLVIIPMVLVGNRMQKLNLPVWQIPAVPQQTSKGKKTQICHWFVETTGF